MKKVSLGGPSGRERGSGGLEVSRMGLGCMGMSAFYGGAQEDDAASIATIHRALELGVNFIDTAEMYGPFINEELVAKAIAGHRDKVVLATKFGLHDHRTDERGINSRPENIKKAVDGSLRRLQTDYIDLLYQHRVDPQIPIEEVVGYVSGLVEQGKVRCIGLSEAGVETIRKAHRTHPITALQSEYSLWTRDPEDGVLETVRELGIGFVAYSPLGRGFLTGAFKSSGDLAKDDFRRNNPRFQGENFDANLRIVRQVEAIADELRATPAQVALAWLLTEATM